MHSLVDLGMFAPNLLAVELSAHAKSAMRLELNAAYSTDWARIW